jgi:hypothetical protein
MLVPPTTAMLIITAIINQIKTLFKINKTIFSAIIRIVTWNGLIIIIIPI